MRARLPHAASRLLCALLAGAVAFGVSACALIVGDPSGDYVSSTADATKEAGVAVKDGTTHADQAAEASSKAHEDAVADANGEATRDGKVEAGRDASGLDGSGDGTAPRDAYEPDAADAVHDAGVKDVHEASAEGGGFCANYDVPSGMSFFCDDFDEVSSVGAFGYVTLAGADASVVVQSAQSMSPPNALLLGASSINTTGEADVGRAAAAKSKLTLDFDLKVGSFYVDGPYTQFASVSFASGATLTLGFNPTDSGTVSSIYVIEHDSTSGQNVNITHPSVSFELNGWNHVSIALQAVGSGAQDTVTVGGTAIDAAHGLGPGYFQGAPSIFMGWTYLDGPGRREAYVDNVVVLSE